MMKLVGSNPWLGNAISRVFGALFYTTEVLPSSSTLFESLSRSIFQDRTWRASIVPVLDQWIKEGRGVKQPDLQDCINRLRKSQQYNHALQIAEWMSDEMKLDLSPADVSARLDLISKVRGLEEAEKYFDGIPDQLKGLQAYFCLLHCYVQHKSLEQAETIFQKMKELGFAKGLRCYNTMLTLYSQMGKYRKLDILVKEMEEKGIGYNIYTLNLQLKSYAATSDIDRMEKLLLKMEADPLVTMDWLNYNSAANAFLRVGLPEKAQTLLRRSEQLITSNTRKVAYECLLASYASLGNKHEVYRIWNLYKCMGRFYNNGYRRMLTSLVKMDDIDGAEKIVEEWESRFNTFDILIPNLLVNAFCKKGLLEKARSYSKKLAESGREDVSTWALLATGYSVNGQMTEAVEALKMAANLENRSGWKFNHLTVTSCLVYLKKTGEVEVAHELLRLLRERGHLTTAVCDELKNCMNDEPQVFGALFYSTQASPPPPLQSLYRRILRLGNENLRASIPPMLNQWVAQAGDVKQLGLQAFIVKLCKSNLYNHALHVSTWMSDELKLDLTPGDIAARIDLISKVHGPEEAHKYFHGVPDPGLQAYSALLHCYAQHKLADKAETVFQEMKELGFVIGIGSYNTMLGVYFKKGEHGKLDVLVKEMEEKGIDDNNKTLMLRLYSYAAVSDIYRMEKVLLKMEADPLVTINWRGYVAAARAFMKAGQLEKALTLLKGSEKFISNCTREIVYKRLLSFYAAIGKKDEVDRIWNLYKNMGKFYNNGYRCMLVSSVKMDDIDGAEKIVEEWESEFKKFDIQIPNLLVNAYCKKGVKKGVLEKAKSYVEKLAESGKEDVSTWYLLGKGYHMNGHVSEAVEAIKKAANLPCRPGWRFNHSTLAACLEYLKEKGDVETAHELLRLLTEKGHITTTFCETLKNCVNGETQVLRSLVGEEGNHLEVMDKIQDGGTETTDCGAQRCG